MHMSASVFILLLKVYLIEANRTTLLMMIFNLELSGICLQLHFHHLEYMKLKFSEANSF